jgi:hypothetical protein
VTEAKAGPLTQVPSADEPFVREARLRAEYADYYPEMLPDMWYLASTVASALRHGVKEPPRDHRPMSDAHFEFRGRVPARVPNAKTRSSDGPEGLSP